MLSCSPVFRQKNEVQRVRRPRPLKPPTVRARCTKRRSVSFSVDGCLFCDLWSKIQASRGRSDFCLVQKLLSSTIQPTCFRRSALHERSGSSAVIIRTWRINKRAPPRGLLGCVFFLLGCEVGAFKRDFYIHDAAGKTRVTKNSFDLARRTFGKWIEKSVAA